MLRVTSYVSFGRTCCVSRVMFSVARVEIHVTSGVTCYKRRLDQVRCVLHPVRITSCICARVTCYVLRVTFYVLRIDDFFPQS